MEHNAFLNNPFPTHYNNAIIMNERKGLCLK
jgi:hypothetical protein